MNFEEIFCLSVVAIVIIFVVKMDEKKKKTLKKKKTNGWDDESYRMNSKGDITKDGLDIF